MKVAVVTPIPTPYRDPFWSRVASQPGVELDVYYCSAGKQDRPWEATWQRNYHWEILPGRNLLSWRGPDASCYWNRDISSRLAAGRYDAIVVGGYNHITMLSAVAFARRRDVPYFVMCESYERAQPMPRWKQAVKSRLVRDVMSRAAGTFPTGRLATEYVQRYGAAPERITALPNVPDVDHLSAEATRLRAEAGRRERDDQTAEFTILFVGRLIPKKRADLLIRAFHSGCRDAPTRLTIVGDGPQRSSLEQLVRELGLPGRVEFAGFEAPARIVRWYSSASVFVLPSSETWGVAAVEALSCHTPVILSNQVGCHPDVVTAPQVGQVVPAGEEAALAEALGRAWRDPAPPQRVSEAWAATRESFRYSNLARRFILGIEKGMRA